MPRQYAFLKPPDGTFIISSALGRYARDKENFVPVVMQTVPATLRIW